MITPAIEKITEYDWLLASYKRAEKHCRRSRERAAFVFQLPDQIKRIQEEIRAGIYKFGPYTAKIVIDPKRRVIHKAPFRDRVVHQAIYKYLEDGFDRRMIFQSYACRKNKGTSTASSQIAKWTRNHDYALKLDMAKYFSSINHERLLEKLRPQILDQGLWDFIENLVNSFEHGIPIGNLTSQLFANWYLNEADHFIKRELKVKCYARYMDDLILFSDSKAQLWEWRTKIKDFVEIKEKLTIPSRKTVLVSTQKGGVPFLGYWFFKDKMPRLQQRTLNSQKKRLRQLRQGAVTSESYLNSSAGWWGHAAYAISPKLAEDMGVADLAEAFGRNRF